MQVLREEFQDATVLSFIPEAGQQIDDNTVKAASDAENLKPIDQTSFYALHEQIGERSGLVVAFGVTGHTDTDEAYFTTVPAMHPDGKVEEIQEWTLNPHGWDASTKFAFARNPS